MEMVGTPGIILPETNQTEEHLSSQALEQETDRHRQLLREQHTLEMLASKSAPKKPILKLMVGLPYSGKTTLARTMGAPIVNPDAVRLELHGHRFRRESEPMVWAHVGLMVRSLFRAGHDEVILDACNVSEKRRAEWESDAWSTMHVLVETDAETCLARAREAEDAAIVEVIERMTEAFEWPGTWRP